MEELIEYNAKSGDIYKVRRLKFLERNDVFRAANKITSTVDPKTKKTNTEAYSDTQTLYETMLQYCIVEAPWLEKQTIGKINLDLLNGIKIEDAQGLIEFVDGINFPKEEEISK